MFKGIMDFLQETCKGSSDFIPFRSYRTEKFSYDTSNSPRFKYDDDTDKKICGIIAETDSFPSSKPQYRDLTERAARTQENYDPAHPLFTYFLDGSRHVYKVDDIAFNGKIFPVTAGQIGVGCLKRINRFMQPQPHLLYHELVLVLPGNMYSRSFREEAVFSSLKNKLNEKLKTISKKLNYSISFADILLYRDTQGLTPEKIEDKAIAKIQDRMIELEKKLVRELVSESRLNQESYLIKDGPLEYKSMRAGDERFRELRKIENNYKYVLGISKSFNPESICDRKGKPIADFIAKLEPFHRTPAFLYENEDYCPGVSFAVWYLRLRQNGQTLSPFDGIIKIEKLLVKEEKENKKMDSERIDTISAYLLNERCPTCYGRDRRWANHLYPIFVTEEYIKSRYLSTDTFLRLF